MSVLRAWQQRSSAPMSCANWCAPFEKDCLTYRTKNVIASSISWMYRSSSTLKAKPDGASVRPYLRMSSAILHWIVLGCALWGIRTRLVIKPPRFALLREVPMHMLGLQELLQPLLAQLARAAAELHPAERPGVVVGERV